MSAPAHNAALEAMWLSAPHGRLCPWQQARALALREASRELHSGRTQLEWIAARVVKVGGDRLKIFDSLSEFGSQVLLLVF